MADAPKRPQSVLERLKASQLREVIHQYADALRARRQGIDQLNVYPVPDGDTGTNMSLTVQSVVAELKNAATDDMHAIAQAISRGAIMGARGNSGAILAQVLRGIAESVKEKTALDPQDIAEALERARKSAYESVLKPVEGTILTVVTAAANAARISADAGHTLKDQLDHVRNAGAVALARTPELLPVLKQAGVVDAGGSGFLLFLDALRYVVTGEPIPGATDAEGAQDGDANDRPDISALAEENLSALQFEVMFLLDGDDDGIPAFRESWSHLGDSIVVVGGDGVWNCHIHTDDIGGAIEAALDFGRPHQIRVSDLRHHLVQDHVGQEHPGQDHVGQESGEFWHKQGLPGELITTGVVAVVNGEGLSQIYRSCGVHQLVRGGQSMNPSVAELLSAVEATPSRSVIFLPNNKNIFATARQLEALTAKQVVVIPTPGVLEGLAALMSFDSSKPIQQIAPAMEQAARDVVSGEVTRAVRDAQSPAGPVRYGDWIGIGPDGICVIAASMEGALVELTSALADDHHEMVTVIEGSDATADVTQALRDWLQNNRPSIEIEIHFGGQPLYPYLVGVE